MPPVVFSPNGTAFSTGGVAFAVSVGNAETDIVVDGVGATRLVVPRSSELDEPCAETKFEEITSRHVERDDENMMSWPNQVKCE